MRRREFLKLSFLPIALTFLYPKGSHSQNLTGKKRLALSVDLRVCGVHPGCRLCIDACHEIHNVPDIPEEKEIIRWIWASPFEKVFGKDVPRTFLSSIGSLQILCLCNHCSNPPCVKVCPVKATWKRDDGVVMIDYHRCIGCRYCMAACPYGARSFNFREPSEYIKKRNKDFPVRIRGVVEKCNFCEEIVSRGGIPKCVDACKYGGLKFGDLNDPESEVSKALKGRFSIVRKPHLGTNPNVYYVF